MKKRLLSLITLLIFLVVMVSCSDEDKTRDVSFGTNGFTLSYTLNNPESVLSRSAIDVEQDEDMLHSFYLLFFESSSGGTGSFIDAIDMMPSPSTPIPCSGNLYIEFPEGSPLKTTEQYNILLCGNISAYTGISGIDPLISFCYGKTENEVTRSLLTNIKGAEPGDGEQDDNSNRMLSGAIPMGAKYVKEANTDLVSIDLTRTVSRFDVFNEASGYELVSASVWNAYTKGFVWEGNFTDYTAPRTERFYGVSANAQKEITGGLYAFENYVPEPVQNDKVSTCLIIGLKNLLSADNSIEYFRTNVNVSAGLGQQLKRNTAYRTIVKNVYSQGSDTERGAYENDKLLLDIDVNGWVEDESGTIQIDGNNVLAMPTATARLFAQGETREYYLYTIGQGVPAITGEHLPDNIKATLKLAPGYSESSDFKKSILTFTAAPGLTMESESYNIEISFSTMVKSITVEQTEENRDYLRLSPAEMIELPAASGQSSGNITVTSSGTWVADLHNSTYFSFSTSSKIKEEGTSGQNFKIYTRSSNTSTSIRYWFVRVYLKDKPEISHTLVIAQKR